MYVPPLFSIEDRADVVQAIRAAPFASLVTGGPDGLIASPLPLLLDESEGEFGVLYGHLARANPHWQAKPSGEAMAIFMGPNAYVSPSWYPSKAEHGRVVPTWNYVAVHAYGPVEFFDDPERLREVVTRLTNHHERGREPAWQVADAPEPYIAAQLRAIVGVRLPVTRIDAKRKMSQNRSAEDRAGVAAGLARSEDPADRAVAPLIPR